MERGYIALLDVLGFSALVGGDATGERLRTYLKCLETISDASAVNFVVFSDSIVLTAEGAGDEPLIAVARGCSNLLAALLAQGIALRGAITFGEVFRSSAAKSVFVAGRAVVDAYRYEREQDWVGIMVAPNAVKQCPDLGGRCELLLRLGDGNHMEDFDKPFDLAAYIQPCHDIPFHTLSALDEKRFDGFAIVLTQGPLEAKNLRDSVSLALENLRWLRSIAPTPDAQQKYARTINWLSSVHYLWSTAAFRQQQDAERRGAPFQ